MILIMDDSMYRDILRDFAFDLTDKTKDESIYENTPFNRGYISALYFALTTINNKAISFGIDPGEVFPNGFDPDKWFREGKGYWL